MFIQSFSIGMKPSYIQYPQIGSKT